MSTELFFSCLDWLRETYWDHRFYLERDLVWTMQKWLHTEIHNRKLQFIIHSEYPMQIGQRHHRTDLAILPYHGNTSLAVEIKYEPDHNRGRGDMPEILPTKFPVVFWDKEGVFNDIDKCKQYIAHDRCSTAISLFVDEGKFFRNKDAYPGTKWIDWNFGNDQKSTVSILLGVFESNSD